MRVEQITTDTLRIDDAPDLDPIYVTFIDYGPGRGRVVVACYCAAWTAAWSAMENKTVREFVASCCASYLASALRNSNSTHMQDEYLLRVVSAVKDALKYNPQPAHAKEDSSVD